MSLEESLTPALVSVVIPCYNTERYLAEALESALGQSYHPLEIIVVDDGSTDGSARVAERFGDRIRWIARDHCGIAGTRNHGVTLARGEFLAFLDADDVWTRDKTERQMSRFDQDPTLGVVAGEVEQFMSPELENELEGTIQYVTGTIPVRMPGTTLIRRAVFDRVGPFSTELESGEFLDWIARAEALGVRSAQIPGIVMRRRIHDANHGRRRPGARGDYLKVVKSALDRKRSVDASPS